MATPRGVRNNNPGNIRYVEGVTSTYTGCVGSDGAFCKFDTAENGIRALGKLLRIYQSKHGLRTIRGIITRWAPPSENDTEAYIAVVVRETGIADNEVLDLQKVGDLFPLVVAIIRHENGLHPYPMGQVQAALEGTAAPVATQPAAPIEDKGVQMEQPAATASWDWGTITKVGGALAGFFNPFVGALITGFGPLLQQKIAAEIGRHTDPETAKNVAANLSDVITKAATGETGKTNEIEVLQAVAQNPAVLGKIEEAVVSRLDQLQPFLDRLHAQSKDEWAAEEESRKLAAERVAASPDGPKIQQGVLRYTLWLLAGVLVYVGGLIGLQMWLSNGEEPNGQLLILFVMLATMIANVYRTVADWSYGSSKNSAAKDVTISEIPRR